MKTLSKAASKSLLWLPVCLLVDFFSVYPHIKMQEKSVKIYISSAAFVTIFRITGGFREQLFRAIGDVRKFEQALLKMDSLKILRISKCFNRS
jgi:hypothetical protein